MGSLPNISSRLASRKTVETLESWLEVKDEEEKPCCDTPDIAITDDGTRICRNCGLTFGQETVSQERWAYTADEVRNRKRTEPRWRCLVPGP